MAAFTASVSGNWNDGATWGNASPGTVGVDFPGASDTATIGAQKIVTIPVGYSASCGAITYGTGISSAHTGLVINGSLTMGGALTMHSTAASYSDLSLGAGATLTMGANNVVMPDYGSSYTYLSFSGTSGSRCTITSSGGAFITAGGGGFGYTDMNIAYSDFSGLGASFSGLRGGPALSVKVSHCTFASCSTIYCPNANATQAANYFEYCDFSNSSNSLMFSFNHNANTVPTGRNELLGCTFHSTTARTIQFNGAGKAIKACLFLDVKPIFASYAQSNTRIVQDNFFAQKNAVQNLIDAGNASTCTTSNNYYYCEQANPHFYAASGGTHSIESCVFETNSQGTITDQGDCIMVYNAATVLTVKNNLCIGTRNNSPLLSALGGASSTGSKVFDNNTIVSKGDFVLPAFSVGETYAGFTGMIDSIRNNIVVGHANQAAQTYQKIVRDLSGTISGIVTAADYNAYQNITTRYSIIGGTYGANDINANPNFVDDTRNLATWDAANGGPGTAANALTELFKLNQSGYNTAYSVTNLLTWVKAGFVPTNIALKGAGYDGSDIGAFPVSSFNIKIGSTTVTKIYIGSTQISKVYLGSTQI